MEYDMNYTCSMILKAVPLSFIIKINNVIAKCNSEQMYVQFCCMVNICNSLNW